MASVFTVFTMARSSTILAVCGSSSLIHVPFLPCCCELEDGAGNGKRVLPGGHAGDPLAHSHASRAVPCRDSLSSFGL